jgi:hypothetical protein
VSGWEPPLSFDDIVVLEQIARDVFGPRVR